MKESTKSFILKVFVILFLSAICVAPVFFFVAVQDASAQSSKMLPASREILKEMNLDRASSSESSLATSSKLVKVAQKRAEVMAKNGLFSHLDSKGKSVFGKISAAGYKYVVAGENLALGFDTAHDAEVAWMNSPTHRSNIIDSDFKDVGIGIAVGSYNGETEVVYIVVLFGRQ